MSEENIELYKYPIGNFKYEGDLTFEEIKSKISELQILPSLLIEEVKNLNNEQLDTSYREGGWTLRQVVHHIADSHSNAFIRFKLSLTEDNPTIKPYSQSSWAETADSKNAPVQLSLYILEGLHGRFVLLLNSMSFEDFDKTFFHPEQKNNIPLKRMLSLYAWHGKHHLNQIISLKKRMGW